jgi:DNA-binding response OmpR family regulator
MKEDVLKGYKAGADDYLNKPLTLLKFALLKRRNEKRTKTTLSPEVTGCQLK